MPDSVLRGRGLTKRFGGLTAVSDVDIDVVRGEILGLIGPNGAGKSTLFRLISGVMKPSAGTIELLGKPMTGKSPNAICVAGIAFTHQIVRPLRELSVRENVSVGAAFGRSPRASHAEVHRIVDDVLRFIGLADRADAEARSLTLSGQKRLEIARALATDPAVLLLDEVLAGLNPTETDRTLELIREVRDRGVTIVMVEHNLRAVRSLCSRIVVLVEGHKIVEGAPDAVLSDQRVVDAYLGSAAHA